MPRFFISDPPLDSNLVIMGEDARHIGRSLRMRLGDNITVCCQKTDYICRILKISDEAVICEILSKSESIEPSIDLTLFMAVPKLDKLELIVQKATELGAVKIVPVMTERCVSRPDGKQFSKKRERLERIALEAAKQSGRGIVPSVSDIIGLKECIESMRELDLGIVCYEKGGQPLGSFEYKSGMKVGLLVGSEGGFSPSEAESFRGAGLKLAWLGQRILRCETAPLAAISIIMNLSGNM